MMALWTLPTLLLCVLAVEVVNVMKPAGLASSAEELGIAGAEYAAAGSALRQQLAPITSRTAGKQVSSRHWLCVLMRDGQLRESMDNQHTATLLRLREVLSQGYCSGPL